MSAELTDLSLMPFGKYKGKPLQDVPAKYFHWLWTQGNIQVDGNYQELAKYIKHNLSALKEEYPDGIWT